MVSKNYSTIVIALGGNAITREFEEGNIFQQFANTRKSLVSIIDMVQEGYNVVITHGNGPQVGNALIRVEEARHIVPPIPLGVLVADTEGGMGYMIEQSLQNMLIRKGLRKRVVTILTQVIVDKNDPSILEPTKFVGPFFKEEEVEKIRKERGWILKKDSDRGWRRVVPSPYPLQIAERDTIRELVYRGTIVIACGGGGIPVYIEDDGTLEGVDGVIDKDRASAVLADDIGAEQLHILTAVDKVALNFGTKDQKDLDVLTKAEARKYLEAGQFPAGSMGPKIEAAITFLNKGGKEVLITSVENYSLALQGKTGTKIVP
ncbi:carbamate kinase [candidate division KSB1 bacterium]|nr:MAG: carbamate kinase [candidate division KSB1 bacterium]